MNHVLYVQEVHEIIPCNPIKPYFDSNNVIDCDYVYNKEKTEKEVMQLIKCIVDESIEKGNCIKLIRWERLPVEPRIRIYWEDESENEN